MEMDRIEWLKRRKQGISGTDVAAILGFDKYRDATHVWLDKRSPDCEDISPSEAAEWGHLLEPVVATKFASENGVEIVAGELIEKEERGVKLMGTPDFLIKGVDEGLEIKTAGFRVAHEWGESGTLKIPTKYYIQCQWYMMLTGYKKWHLAALIGGQDFRTYTIPYSPAVINSIVVQSMKFWKENVEKNLIPDTYESNNFGFALQSTIIEVTERYVSAPIRAYAYAEELFNVKNAIEQMSKKKLELENQLKHIIGSDRGLEATHWRASWVPVKARESIDYKQLIKDKNIEESELKKYTTVSESSRMFKLTKLGEE